jgi:hypothetical protein
VGKIFGGKLCSRTIAKKNFQKISKIIDTQQIGVQRTVIKTNLDGVATAFLEDQHMIKKFYVISFIGKTIFD